MVVVTSGSLQEVATVVDVGESPPLRTTVVDTVVQPNMMDVVITAPASLRGAALIEG